jgi:hypothetical protein
MATRRSIKLIEPERSEAVAKLRQIGDAEYAGAWTAGWQVGRMNRCRLAPFLLPILVERPHISITSPFVAMGRWPHCGRVVVGWPARRVVI